ncbi:MAG: PQQ-dependent sugar dehydrogenase [Chloroflexota bacterium]
MHTRLPISGCILILLLAAACTNATLPVTLPPVPSLQTTQTAAPPTPTELRTPFVENTAATVPVTGKTATQSARPSQTPTPRPPQATAFPAADAYTWVRVADGFTQPVGLAVPHDGTGRLFVLEQSGLIHILGRKDTRPVFLDLRTRASTRGSTVHGLLGMAFHPRYAENGHFFVHYTDTDGKSIIARYRVSSDPDAADANTEERLATIAYPIGEHIGGDLAFGPDGALYIPIGDGGGAGNYDQAGNAQNPAALPGSLLRLDVDGRAQPEVWASGLRNPWRIAFDALTGNLFIADVGENKWEEINFLPAGSSAGTNFGWPYFEGTHSLRGQAPDGVSFATPVAEYDHTAGCSVTGGQVYRGKALPEWFGVYFYGDFCQGVVWGLLQLPDGSWLNERLFQLSGTLITSFAPDESGELYLVDYTGEIYRLERK